MTHDEFLIHGPKINAMTNWQRHQWARLGYKIDQITHCLSLKRGEGKLRRPTLRSGYNGRNRKRA